MENIKRNNEWARDLIRQQVTSVRHRNNLVFLTGFEPPRHHLGWSTKLWRLLNRPATTRLQWEKTGNEVVLGAIYVTRVLLGSAISIAFCMVMDTEKFNYHRLPWLNETRKLFYRNSPRFPCRICGFTQMRSHKLGRRSSLVKMEEGKVVAIPLSPYNFSPGNLPRAILLPLISVVILWNLTKGSQNFTNGRGQAPITRGR